MTCKSPGFKNDSPQNEEHAQEWESEESEKDNKVNPEAVHCRSCEENETKPGDYLIQSPQDTNLELVMEEKILRSIY